MARWIVPAGSNMQLTTLETNSDVIHGEIVFNTDDHSLQIGVVPAGTAGVAGAGEFTSVLTDGEVINSLIANSTIELGKFATRAANEILIGTGTGVDGLALSSHQLIMANAAGNDLAAGLLINDNITEATIALTKLAALPANSVIVSGTGTSVPTATQINNDDVVGKDGSGAVGSIKVKTNHIANDQVTYGKMQNPGETDVLLGNNGIASAGVADADEYRHLSVAEVRAMLSLDTAGVRSELSAGDGLDYADGQFSHTDTSSVADVTETNLTYLSGVTFDTYGHVLATDTQQISAGNQIDISTSGEIKHSDVSAGADIAEASLTYMSGITLDGNGHVTATDSQGISAGNQITISSTGEIKHEDVTEASDVTAVFNTYVSNITVDGNGHVTAMGTQGISSGEGIDLSDTGVISGEDASTTNKGIARFNPTDFSVSSGIVALNESKIYGDFSAGSGLDYDSAGGFTHSDTSSIADIAEVINTGGNPELRVLTGATFDTYGHVQTMLTETLNDGDNIVFDHTTNSGITEISVPRASTTTRGAAQFNSGDFGVDANGLVSLGSINGGTMIDANSISLDRLPQINNFGFLGSDESGATDTEVLTPDNVLDLLNLNVGNGLEFNTTDNTINVQNLAFANNYVFTTTASRNTGVIGTTTITWHPGDIAITTTSGVGGVAETWLYIGADGVVGAVTDAAFVETTQNPTNIAATPSATSVVISSSTGSDGTISSATTSLAGVMTAADKSKLNGIEASANAYNLTIMSDGDSTAGSVSNSETLQFTASGAAAVSRTDETITISATNTTYGAGGGLDLTGTVFSHSDTSNQASVNNSGTTVIRGVTLDGYGHVSGLDSVTLTDSDTTYSVGTGLSASGTVFSHADTSNQASVNNSGNTVIQDITLDSFGHITGINSTSISSMASDNYADSLAFNASNGILTIGRTGTLTDLTVDLDGRYLTSATDTTYSAGNGIGLSGTTFSVAAGTGLTQQTSGLALNLGAKTWTGNQTAPDFCVTSDKRLKSDIETVCCALDKVNEMRGVSYTFAATGEKKVGVIAQEMEEVVPEVVHTNGAGMKSVAYGNLVGVLIEAVKELTARVEELENGSK